MTQLMDHFDRGETKVITQPHTIHGLGGVGKTRLAVEYAWKAWEAERYDVLLFIVGDTPEALLARFAELARPGLLDLPAYAQGHDAALAAVFQRLQTQHDWLLLIDNIDTEELQEAVKEQLLPHLPGGRVLMTSRLSNWWDGVRDVRIEQLSAKDGAAYLLAKTDGKRKKAKGDAAQARAVSEMLDGLPVALEQAGAYISRLGLGFEAFQTVYNTSAADVLGWDGKTATNHKDPVVVLWDTTIAQLGLPERALLRLLAFLAPDPVPMHLFENGGHAIVQAAVDSLAEETGATTEPLGSIPEALGNLAAWSMATRADDTVQVHRLVQAATRVRIPKEAQRIWTQHVVNLLNAALPGGPSQVVCSWPTWRSLERHVEVVVDACPEAEGPDGLSQLLLGLAVYLDSLGLRDAATSRIRRVSKIDKASQREDHPNRAAAQKLLVQLLQAKNWLA